MAVDKKSLKKMFPNLYRELSDENSENKVSIDAVRTDPEAAERAAEVEDVCEEEFLEPTKANDKLRHFNPSAVDFIRRCDTEIQAESIIAFMENRGEIHADYAEQLRQQLRRDGIRSFGPKKEDCYYFKEGQLC